MPDLRSFFRNRYQTATKIPACAGMTVIQPFLVLSLVKTATVQAGCAARREGGLRCPTWLGGFKSQRFAIAQSVVKIRNVF
ncbi:hypothetical protein [Kingella oralis]|uniref:hypothetical protein n=1 Tax=Kingella oralis TaxID=505 RepID=UPI0034E5F6B3